MRVCTVLATYNGEKYIEEQIESILNQTGNFTNTLIISDDGSIDGTLSLLEKYKNSYNNIYILDNGGVKTGSAAANFFRALRKINLSDYEYIALSDQDDIWLPDKISRALEMIGSNHCYLSNLTLYYEGIKSNKLLERASPPTALDYVFQGGSAGCTYVVRVDCIELILNVLKNITLDQLRKCSHDWLIYSISRSYGCTWFRDATSKILYRQHSNNLHGATIGWGGALKRIHLLRKSWYLDNIVFNLKFCALENNEENIIHRFIVKGDNIFEFKLILLRRAFVLRRRYAESFLVFVYFFFFVWRA